jgi:hypothetical protein
MMMALASSNAPDPCFVLMNGDAMYLLAALETRTSLFIVFAVLLLILSRVLAILGRRDGARADRLERASDRGRQHVMHQEVGPKFGALFRALSWSAVGLAVAAGALALVEATLHQRWESRSAQRVEAWRASDVARDEARDIGAPNS